MAVCRVEDEELPGALTYLLIQAKMILVWQWKFTPDERDLVSRLGAIWDDRDQWVVALSKVVHVLREDIIASSHHDRVT